ncbi:chromosome segregation protein SMC [Aquisalimonas lutea]|uniref:chromosome segregation protein SMC n=1 Tax=Aquisalimonas lutea TaxID=1327750 RepID=UPI0025B5BAD9|nr:chromosome segregation protein SMC [Aquisalimonas lutea]MDN3518005.1 chromosome segregation protein SMC [Aquisalimonas lutea]
MRLKKIKLAGFKSFVDPTTVHLPSNLVGVVGPNGCGKSNVIDAVRWVMGESSAKHLRGESMSDVIFNGSSSRKPVSQASIELVFDNADGTLGGQYASYSEISVKRQVNREGQSQYLLNGTRCRKRDITDVFLGTGLGPRSYSIIEQGMISRIIEAKPDELRVYLEEAAGISLYKERRRETERRIRDTRENLERLDDVREEVAGQLDKLSRQARTAERYKEYKKEERQLRAELLAIRLRGLVAEMRAGEQALEEKRNALEAEVGRQRAAERELVEQREQQSELGEEVNTAQGRYYSLGSEIARVEQQIQHERERQKKQADDLAANSQALEDLQQTIRDDEDKLAAARDRLAELTPEIEELQGLEETASDQVIEAQQAMDDWQRRWEAFNEAAAQAVQQAQVERTRIEGLEQRQQELARRRERLVAERDQLDPDAVAAELDELTDEAAELAERQETLAESLEEAQRAVTELAEQETELDDSIHDLRGEIQQGEARLTSLETLQQDALGAGDDGPVVAWLARHGLDGHPRLAQILSVAAGWERAVEAVLAERLQAVCVGEAEMPAADALGAPEQGRATLLRRDGHAPSADGGRDGLEPLAAHVTAPAPLADLLHGVFCAGDAAAAERLRGQLGPGERLVTPEGMVHGRGWSQVAGGDGDSDGLLERERAMEELRASLEASREWLETLLQQRRELEERRMDHEETRDRLREERDTVAQRLTEVRAREEGRRQRLDELRERGERLAHDIDALDREAVEVDESVRSARARLQEAMDRSEADEEQRQTLQAEREQHEQALNDAREVMRERRERRHELSLKQESASSAQQSLEEQLRRLRDQQERLQGQQEELRAAGDEQGDPVPGLEAERERLLQQRVEAEQALTAARERVSAVESRLRELEEQRQQAEQRVEALRGEVEQMQLRDQELRVHRQTQSEQLVELGFDLDTLQANLPESAAEADWQARLEQVEQRINRLGPINLAAIDEHEQLSERKGYLDQQHADLTEAMETLESAIRKIDRETRQRFRETFDKVNAGIQRMYPRLFGGGEAYLEMTSDDLLETGVTIMARPPGKRVSTIHLLSGGEKALTAVALIFAIFELNPAPFCMLDEVDAPLDEANVGRFCELVQEMSARVQFILITHNKATMEIVSHLMGVTMHEAGVSRLVAVDVDEAAEMAVAV